MEFQRKQAYGTFLFLNTWNNAWYVVKLYVFKFFWFWNNLLITASFFFFTEDTGSWPIGRVLSSLINFIDLNFSKAKLADNFIRVWQKLVYSLLWRNYLCKIWVWTRGQEPCFNKPKQNNSLKYFEQKKVQLISCINQHPPFPLKGSDTDGCQCFWKAWAGRAPLSLWPLGTHSPHSWAVCLFTKSQLHCSQLLF